MPNRHWAPEKVPNDPQERWIVVSDDELSIGVWFPDEASAQDRADWQNEKEAAYTLAREQNRTALRQRGAGKGGANE